VSCAEDALEIIPNAMAERATNFMIYLPDIDVGRSFSDLDFSATLQGLA
jgi:hypothetical protein